MTYCSEYKKKFRTAEQATRLVKSGDWIDYALGLAQPLALDKALAARKHELSDIKVRAALALTPKAIVEQDKNREVFTYSSWHFSSYDRQLHDKGLCNHIPMLFRNQPHLYKHELVVDVAMVAVSPMDTHGYFNFSMSNSSLKTITETAKIVILEENEHLPTALGGQSESIHISEVDFITKADTPLTILPSTAPDAIDQKVAHLIVEEIVNGATIQLGIGGMPNAVGNLIAESDLKDMGMHTEMLVDAYLKMYKQGKLTNRCKPIDKGKGVWCFGVGSEDLYSWVNLNPGLASYPVDYTNDPHIIAQIDNFISVNNCLEVDLFGQISSESSGFRHISGTGGQLDFVTGAYMSKGGKSFICFKSAYNSPEGIKSRVVPTLLPGSIVTTPRTHAQYLVSEWGKVNIAGASTWERAEKVISLAHPDFRDQLIKSAEKMNIWRKSNKK